jgi:hypothetical protein
VDTQFLVAWPTQKSIQEAEVNQQIPIDWSVVGSKDQTIILNGRFVLITPRPNKGKKGDTICQMFPPPHIPGKTDRY